MPEPLKDFINNEIARMKINELYRDLTEAYSLENLNRISGKLILLYKSRNYSKIRALANKVSQYVAINEEKDARCFSKLIVLYHPDKGEYIKKQMKQLYGQNDHEGLQRYAHILLLSDIDAVSVDVIDESIGYSPEYAWDIDGMEGFGFAASDEEGGDDDCTDVYDFEKSFFNAIKIREYGRIDVEFPTYYLEDFEEYEMAGSGLESLDGVEYCTHVKILDVSDNSISDIGNLWNLRNLEELYLSGNQIGYIDVLSNLTNLRIVDLSGNRVDDISPLFELENLEYVNLLGNPVPQVQIQLLGKKRVLVMK
ncbi:MAG: leucine-rich repeat domain-containing protein [Prolixibacteraceae bacterium]|nr:leucine-rich repeat domain-containing protein [Prolixibacteraceae bacterium]